MGGKKKGGNKKPQEEESGSPPKGGDFKFDFGGSNPGGSSFQPVFDLSNKNNQALLSAMQSQLGNMMVGKSSGYYESLPKAVKNRVRALKKLHESKVEVDKEFKKAMDELEKQFSSKYNVLYEKRTKFISGAVEPKEEELASESEEEGVTIEEVKEDAGKKEEDAKGIPEFWLTVLKHQDEIADLITPEDEEALKFLMDITYKPFSEEAKPKDTKEKPKKKKTEEEEEEEEDGEKHGFSLEFHFAENPFFDDKVISKTYFLQSSDVYGDIYDYAEGSEIHWKPEENLTMKKVTKTQKPKGKKGKGQPAKSVTVEQRVDSFFNFFYPNEMINQEEPGEEDEQYLESDYETGVIIKDTVIPNAVLWFTGELTEDFGPGFDMGDFEDGEDEEEGEESEYVPPPGEKPPECKQQ